MNQLDRTLEMQDLHKRLMDALVRITALEDEVRELRRAQPETELEAVA